MAAVANVAINVDSRSAAQKLKDLDRRARRTETAFDKLGSAAVKLGGALAGLQAASFVFAKTAELEKQTRSLQVLTGSLENAKKVVKELQQFGVVTPFTSEELIETAKRLKAFGFETERIVDVTKRLSDIAGATGADLGGIATAFGQIQAKGRLQGEELLQLQERGVDLQGTLRKEYGLTAEEFQKALSKGQIGADAVNLALVKLTEAGGKYAGGAVSQSDTLSGKLSTLQDNVDNLARTLGSALSPAVKGVLDIAIEGLGQVNKLFTEGKLLIEIGLLTAAFVGLNKVIQIFLASKLATFLLNQATLMQAFGAKIYFTAAAQGVLNGVMATGSALMAALPLAAVTLGVIGLVDALRQAATDQDAFNKLLSEGTVEQLKNALATEEANLALAKRFELQGRGAGRAADRSRIERSQSKIQQLEQALAEGMLGGGSLPQGQTKSAGSLKLPKSDDGGSKAADKLKQQVAAGARLAQQFERQKMLLQASNDLGRSLLQIEFSRADAIQRINETAAETQKQDLIAAANAVFKLETLQKIDEFGKSALEQADALINRTNQQIADEKRREELIAEGINPALADELVKIESTFKKQQEKLEAVKLMLQAQLALVDATSEEAKKIQEVIDKIKEKQQVLGQTQEKAEDNAKETDEEKKAREKAEKLKAMMEDLKKNAIASVATALEDALVTTLEKAITGAEDLGEALQGIASSLLKDLGRMFIRSGISGLGGLMGFADGGFAQPGKSYVVGERGPELLTMSASGGYVTSNSSSEAAMDRYSGSGGNGGSISVNYNVTEINQMKFVTEDQFRAGITQAAKQGADGGFNKTMTSLKNNRSTRSRVGI